MMARWAVFLSGTGSNFQAMLELRDCCDIQLLISDKAAAPGIARAKRMGIPVLILKKPADWNFIFDELIRRRIHHIFLLGFMKIVPAHFISRWETQGTIINLHPSLLPDYPGLHSIAAAFQENKYSIGVTIHHVVAEVDAGPFVLQKSFITKEETLSECEFRVHRLEHRMVRKIAEKWPTRMKAINGKTL